jgi:hypothetical protein
METTGKTHDQVTSGKNKKLSFSNITDNGNITSRNDGRNTSKSQIILSLITFILNKNNCPYMNYLDFNCDTESYSNTN